MLILICVLLIFSFLGYAELICFIEQFPGQFDTAFVRILKDVIGLLDFVSELRVFTLSKLEYSILYKFSSVPDYSIKHKVFCMADLLVYFVIVLIFVGYLLKWISCTIFYIIHESRTDKYC